MKRKYEANDTICAHVVASHGLIRLIRTASFAIFLLAACARMLEILVTRVSNVSRLPLFFFFNNNL